MNFRSSATGKLTVEIEVREQRHLERAMRLAGNVTHEMLDGSEVETFTALHEGIVGNLRALDQ